MIQNPLVFSTPVAPTYFCEQTLTFRVEPMGQPGRRDSMGLSAENRMDMTVCSGSKQYALV